MENVVAMLLAIVYTMDMVVEPTYEELCRLLQALTAKAEYRARVVRPDANRVCLWYATADARTEPRSHHSAKYRKMIKSYNRIRTDCGELQKKGLQLE
jgi:hypothetical protein